jgi:hypothetical protein
MTQKICPQCKKEFKTSKFSPYQIYCGKTCLTKFRYHKLKNTPGYKEKVKANKLAWKTKYPDRYKANMQKQNKKQTEKARQNPEYREYLNNLNKRWIEKNPDKKKEYYERDNIKKREKYKKNEEWRDKQKIRTKTYHRENPDVNLKSYLRLLDDPKRLERKKIREKKYWEENKEKILEKNREHYRNNKEYYINYQKKWSLKEENKEKNKVYHKKWYVSGGREVNNKYRREKLKKDPAFRAQMNLRLRLYEFIKIGKYRKYGRFREMLGCDWEYFKEYIKEQFEVGMSWDNYGEWHIDHVIPVTAWDLSKEEDQMLASHYTNLQPLWAIDNIKKSNKF